jgi:hypothetical protein
MPSSIFSTFCLNTILLQQNPLLLLWDGQPEWPLTGPRPVSGFRPEFVALKKKVVKRIV